ncbi:MAG: hypothetical protein KBS75_09145 [Bacteroidales bacterium]|nr:hypothetical protein [Candidatus Equimonas faecalis]
MISEECTINTLSALIQSDDLPFLPLQTIYGQDYAPDGYDSYVISTGKDIREFVTFDPVLLKKDNQVIGKYFLTSIQRKNDNWFQLDACSSIGILDRLQHKGGLYHASQFSEILADIMGAIPYSVPDSRLNSTPISGWLPIATARQNLKSLLFAVGAAATYDENGELIFKYNEPDVSFDLDDDSIFRGNNTSSYFARAKKVSVVEHAWFQDDSVEPEVLFDNTGGTTADNALISFSDPYHSLSWSGASLVPVNCNCCYVSGTGTLTGKKYAHTQRDLVREDPDVDGGEIRISDATLTSSLNSLNILKRVFNYYHDAVELQYTVKSDGFFKCGDLLNFDDDYGEHTFGYVKDMNDNISGNIKSSSKIITNWQPTGLGNTYEHYMVLKSSDLSSGKWSVPAAMRGNPALVVVFSGFGGGQGGFDGTDGENKWFDFPFSGFNNYLPAPGRGGKGGSAGAYPKYIIAEYTALSASYDVAFGNGGLGGAVNGGAGSEGGHSVFGTFDTDNGDLLTGEYINLIDGSVVAAKGDSGFDGGNGGATRPYSQKGSVIKTEISASGDNRFKRYSDAGENGGAVGGYSGGAGCHGGSIEWNYQDDDAHFYEGPGSGGGGAAYGANGGNADEYWMGHALAPKAGGDGANALAPADAILGRSGAGGNGGGGGGAGGIAFGYVGGIHNVVGNHAGTGGDGSVGGKGSDGFALIYY